ncbi:MAG: hypothetical protein HN712_22475 [Gemmatimonadetes bacterium]|nr:hypothetical protein [Gemmatimonadota bacterium]MBT6148420.1 hypothetical protein [Gemmatimonadota bacterium]MBT7863097.1 hypothetical protein [Gemmatimonadota bacterium]
MNSAYHSLREQLEGLLAESRLQSRQASEWEKVETYWQIGDALTAHIDTQPGAKYGQEIVRNLSKDLQLGQTTLYETLRFRRVVQDPNLYARTKCGWSHFRALIHLQTPEQIQHFAKQVQQHGWTTRQLKRAIEIGGDVEPGFADIPSPPLRSRFHQPFTYRVVTDQFQVDGPPAIDFGFHQVWAPQKLAGFDTATVGDRLTIDDDGSEPHAQVREDRPGLWTYVARVLRIIDGDTLDVVVDLGLGHRAYPRLRLRGIDTAELYTTAGRTAKAFVEEALSESPIIIISTWRTDTFGRYLADVKYRPGTDDPDDILRDGTYLNGQLLKQGLATRYLV